MATKTLNAKICQAANTKAGFGSVVLGRLQLAYETDTNMLKVGMGEGITYPAQPYAALDTPVGTTVEMAKKVVPYGYLAQNGQAVSRTTYAALFAVIGTTYGAGDGSTTFNLPNPDQKCTWGTNVNSEVGTVNGTFSHYHNTSTYVAAGGAINNNAGAWAYSAIGRDDSYGFNSGVYTYWKEGDEGTINNIWGINHGSACMDSNTGITSQVPRLYHTYKVIKY